MNRSFYKLLFRFKSNIHHKWSIKGQFVIFLIAMILGLPSIIHAETATVDARTRNDLAFVANGMNVVRDQPELLGRLVIFDSYIKNAKNLNTSGSGIVSLLTKVDNDWKNNRPGYSNELKQINYFTNSLIAAGSLAGNDIENIALKGAINSVLTLTSNYAMPWLNDLINQSESSADQILKNEKYSMIRNGLAEKILQDHITLCKQNGNGYICDQAFEAIFKASVTQSANQICSDHPESGACKFLKSTDPNASVTVDITQAKQEFKNQMDEVNKTVKESSENYKYIDDVLGQDDQSLIDWRQNELLMQKARDIIKASQKAYDQKIKLAQTSIYAISGIVNLVDPKLGNEINVAGMASIQIADSFHKFQGSVADISKLNSNMDNLQNIMSAAASMVNVAGATIQIMSLFQHPEKPPEAIILEELHQVRLQIQELSDQMHKRFDRIDSGLKTIYDKVQDGFVVLENGQWVLEGKVYDISRSLFLLETQLNVMNNSIFDAIDAVGRQDLLLMANKCINYEETYKITMTYDPTFIDCANKFEGWADRVSKDAARAGNSLRNYKTGIPFELQHTLSFNINYFSKYPEQVFIGMKALSDERLASPIDYVIATQSFSKLMQDKPDFAGLLSKNLYENLQQTSLKLTTALNKINNPKLFEYLINDYRSSAYSFDSALQSSLSIYQIDPKINSFDLWSTGDQATKYKPKLNQLRDCSGIGNPIALPDKWRNIFFVDNAIVNLEALQETIIDACYEVGYQNPREFTRTTYPIPNSDGTTTTKIFGYLKLGNWYIDVNFMFSWKGEVKSLGKRIWKSQLLCLDERELTNLMNPPKDYKEPQYKTTAYDILSKAWQGQWTGPGLCSSSKINNISGIFSSGNTVLESNVDSINAQILEVKNYVSNKLVEHQSRYYQQIINESNATGSVYEAIRNLDTSKRVLENYIILGMPSTLENNDFIRALLYGNERLPDNSLIQSQFINAIQSLNNGNATSKVDILPLANKRADALEQELKVVLTKIASGELIENHITIELLRDELNLVARTAGWPVPPPSPTVTLSAEPSTVDYSGDVTLNWKSSNAELCSAFGDWAGLLPVLGSKVVNSLTTNKKFNIVCAANGIGSNIATVNVTVLPATHFNLQVSTISGGSVTSLPSGINCGTACTFKFIKGDEVTLTPTPLPNYSFLGWQGACTNSSVCKITMDAPKTVTATFRPTSDPVLSVIIDGKGSVVSNPVGINCGGICSKAFPYQATLTLSASSQPGYVFTGWSGDCSGKDACTVTMSEAKSVTATFKPFPLSAILSIILD